MRLSFFKPRPASNTGAPAPKVLDPADLEDRRLIDGIAAGQQSALLALYDRYSPRLHGLVVRIVGTSMAAEEVTQDVFLKVWQQARTYRAEQGTVANWLFTIARRTAIDRLRYENRRPTLSDGDDPEPLWQDLPDGNSTSEESRWRALFFAVQALPPEQRQAIDLAYYGGMSHRQIAEALDWPIGTVKTRLRLGMEQLRREWLPSRAPAPTSEVNRDDVSLYSPAEPPTHRP